MNNAQLERLRNVLAQLDAQYHELGHGLKKHADKPISPLKVQSINSLLREASAIFGVDGPRHCPAAFDPKNPPSVSDASFVVAQFVSCGEAVRRQHILFDGRSWSWHFDGCATTAPKAARALP